MTSLLVVAGGLLGATLVVGAILYLTLGRTLEMEWDSGEEAIAGPED